MEEQLFTLLNENQTLRDENHKFREALREIARSNTLLQTLLDRICRSSDTLGVFDENEKLRKENEDCL